MNVCVWFGWYSFLSLFVNLSLFFLFASHLNMPLKINTILYIRIHLRANINGNDRRDMHILMHTRKKTILIHATHSFAFLSASSFSATTSYVCYAAPFAPSLCKFKFLKCRPLSKFMRNPLE